MSILDIERMRVELPYDAWAATPDGFAPQLTRTEAAALHVMSALPLEADVGAPISHVGFGPKGDIRPTSFDHLVGAGE